jgi:putative ABC transport system permease protein
VLDARARRYLPEGEGLLLTDQLARTLGLAAGSPVSVEVLEGNRRVLQARVTGTAPELFGGNAYMRPDALARLLGEAPTASGAHLRVGASRLGEVSQRLKQAPRVAGITSPASMLRSIEEQFAKNLMQNLIIISGFAGVIAIGIIYNGARIGLAERGRELASLRVLGFTRHEVAVILLGEQGVIALLGLPVGWAMGLVYAAVWARALSGEAYRIPIAPSAPSFLLASAVIVAMATLAGAAVRLRIARLDLIAVLKTRE